MNGNYFIVIENGHVATYMLDDRLWWRIGRPSEEGMPEIRLYSLTASRKHGKLQNMDGVWFYVDEKGKNGTAYNGKYICGGLHGRVKPILLKDGDVFVFGGGKKAVVNSNTIWALYTTKLPEETWRVMDTKEYTELSVTMGENVTELESPEKGTVVKQDRGIAIYMGEVTYLNGDVRVTGM